MDVKLVIPTKGLLPISRFGPTQAPALCYSAAHENKLGASALHRRCDCVPHFSGVPCRRRAFAKHNIVSPLVGLFGCGNSGPSCGSCHGGSWLRSSQNHEPRRGTDLSCLPHPDPRHFRIDGGVLPLWRPDQMDQLSYGICLEELAALVRPACMDRSIPPADETLSCDSGRRCPTHSRFRMSGVSVPSTYCAGAGAACCAGGLKFTLGACREPSSALKYASLRVKPDKLATMLLGNSPM